MMDPSSESKALVRKRTDTDLMPPPPPTKRIKRPKNVLDEDTYTEALSQIIARDFFPGLLESQTQQEYLDALESKDSEWISIATSRLKHVMTPGRRPLPASTPKGHAGQTPRDFVGGTPASVRSSTTAAPSVAPKGPAVDASLSLAAFQSRYTSEDNESFYKLLDRQNQKKAEKYAWLWTGNKMPSNMQLKQQQIEDKISQTRSLADDGYEKTQLAIKDKDSRQAAPDSWKWKPRNELMFRPEGVEDKMETLMERAEAESRAPPKEIVYGNTRAPDPTIVMSQDSSGRPPSPTLSAVRDAIAGRPRAADQDSTIGSDTPRVNGYAYVDDQESEPDTTQQPTDSIISLGSGDTTRNPFQLQERGKREDLHHRMVERIAESRRTASRIGMVGKEAKTPVPKLPNSPRVTGGLTPAAQRLWSSLGSVGRRAGSATPFDGRPTPRGKPSLFKRATPKP